MVKENRISDGDGDGDVAVDHEEDDAFSSDDPCSSLDDVFSKVLLQIYTRCGVPVFLVAVYLLSLSCLCEIKVFDEMVLLVLRTGGRYGRGPPYRVLAKHSDVRPCIPLWPRHMVKCSDGFYYVKIS
jgi:hypothetical protein